MERLRDIDILVPIRERTKIAGDLIARLPRLLLISQLGPFPHIDLAACARHSVRGC